jgi:hypothetical protein
VDRKLWTKSYSTFGRFICPRCNRGNLREKDDWTLEQEPDHVTRELQEEGLLGEISVGRFSGLLKCNFKGCGEIVAVAGDYRLDYERQQDHETGEEIEFKNYSYSPFCLRPAPAIISNTKTLNEEIKPHVQRACELFWSDYGSCANRLRIIVEMVLDQLGVARSGPKGTRKDARWVLSDRITELNKARPGHDDVLNALRHVGNTGSHDGDVDFEDLLDCFEFLEYALVELLEQRRENMARRAQEIIARKGRPAS